MTLGTVATLKGWARLFFLGLVLVTANPGIPRGRSGGPGDAVQPGAVRVDASFEHLGVVWQLSGDDDRDSQFRLDYRPTGDPSWQPAAQGMRAYPTLIVNGSPLGLNSWGASAMFLEPGQRYELRLRLTDPDGGGLTRIVSASTRSWPQPDPNGRQRHVVPGSGGGDGSLANPFRGLQAAADAARPGDVFHIAAGTYAPFQILVSGAPGQPVSFLGPGDGSAVVEGGGTSRGVITLGKYDQTIQHIILSGLSLQNGRWGIDAQHSQEIAILHNQISNVDYGIVNRRGDARERNQTVCDNQISGRTPWPGRGIPSERGVDLRGDGNVVCHNTVRNFGDCISVQPATGDSYGNDVFGNDVAYCVDDGIEVDYNQANVRVWRNRVMNARMGVSLQPIRGGPAYIFRNEFFNLESVPLKMHNDTTGFLVAHNTGVKHGNGHGDNGAMWRYAIFRNNLFLGTRYAFEFTTVADEGFRDFDFNAWGTSRTVGPGGPFFKWDNVRYDRLVDLPSRVEDNGITAGDHHLTNAPLPSDWDVPVDPGSRDVRLVATAPEIDAGVNLANLNNPFVTDGEPDMGAFEHGAPVPNYGPRPMSPDFSQSTKTVSLPVAGQGDTVLYRLQIVNVGALLGATLTLTDTLPSGVAYIPGSLTASQGSVDDSGAPTLVWNGPSVWGVSTTITYKARVTTPQIRWLTNTALLDTRSQGILPLSTRLLANGQGIFLPVVR